MENPTDRKRHNTFDEVIREFYATGQNIGLRKVASLENRINMKILNLDIPRILKIKTSCLMKMIQK